MNTSDQNEIKSDISSEIESIDEIDVSLEIESIDGDDDLHFETPHLTEDEIEANSIKESEPKEEIKLQKNNQKKNSTVVLITKFFLQLLL